MDNFCVFKFSIVRFTERAGGLKKSPYRTLDKEEVKGEKTMDVYFDKCGTQTPKEYIKKEKIMAVGRTYIDA